MLLRQVLNNNLDQLGKTMEKEIAKNKVHRGSDLIALIDVAEFSKALSHAVSTGQWSATRASQPVSRKNVCQGLQTQSFLAQLSHYSRVTASISGESKQSSIRSVQRSAKGFLCPKETPDGKQCGLALHLCFGVRVSTASDPQILLAALQPFFAQLGFVPVEQFREISATHVLGYQPNQPNSTAVADANADADAADAPARAGSPVCLDDAHLGFVPDISRFVGCVRGLRRLRQISPDVSVTVEDNEVRLLCCAGRLVRPLLALDAIPQWELYVSRYGRRECLTLCTPDLEAQGLLEYVDASECKSLVVCQSPADMARRTDLARSRGFDLVFTHMEIDPDMIHGVTASLILFSDHNHVTRNSFESAMAKQAVDAFNPSLQPATKHLLDYPQRSLIETRMSRIANGLTESAQPSVQSGLSAARLEPRGRGHRE